MSMRIATVLAVGLMWAARAHAQGFIESKMCAEYEKQETQNADLSEQMVFACTKALSEPNLPPETQAILHHGRAIAHSLLARALKESHKDYSSELRQAIEDLSAAARLAPSNAEYPGELELFKKELEIVKNGR
jgi:hypothetical protein